MDNFYKLEIGTEAIFAVAAVALTGASATISVFDIISISLDNAIGNLTPNVALYSIIAVIIFLLLLSAIQKVVTTYVESNQEGTISEGVDTRTPTSQDRPKSGKSGERESETAQ